MKAIELDFGIKFGQEKRKYPEIKKSGKPYSFYKKKKHIGPRRSLIQTKLTRRNPTVAKLAGVRFNEVSQPGLH